MAISAFRRFRGYSRQGFGLGNGSWVFTFAVQLGLVGQSSGWCHQKLGCHQTVFGFVFWFVFGFAFVFYVKYLLLYLLLSFSHWFGICWNCLGLHCIYHLLFMSQSFAYFS